MSKPQGPDSPPVFRISPQVAGFKHHAILIEPMGIPVTLVFDLEKEDHRYTANGQMLVSRPMGIYGFQTIEARDKFCRVCNGLADAIERRVALPVTIPNLVMDEPMVTTIRYQPQPATGSVASNEETSNV